MKSSLTAPMQSEMVQIQDEENRWRVPVTEIDSATMAEHRIDLAEFLLIVVSVSVVGLIDSIHIIQQRIASSTPLEFEAGRISPSNQFLQFDLSFLCTALTASTHPISFCCNLGRTSRSSQIPGIRTSVPPTDLRFASSSLESHTLPIFRDIFLDYEVMNLNPHPVDRSWSIAGEWWTDSVPLMAVGGWLWVGLAGREQQADGDE
jgi:hypothetical protein